jgi:carbamate kinase
VRVVVALGGNALLRRGEEPSPENQKRNVTTAVRALAPVAAGNELVVSHGNGPQVGLLALQEEAAASRFSLDVLGAETEGMIGYLIERELGNALPEETPIATVLTMVEVAEDDPAFEDPTKPIGAVYDHEEGRRLAADRGWRMVVDGEGLRRVVPSPVPLRIFEIRPVRWLLERGTVVICAGGGGIPTVLGDDGVLRGVEAVVDKDRASALLATELEADVLVMATDVDGVYEDWGGRDPRRIERATPDELDALALETGSMGPKVRAACDFVRATGGTAAIGGLEHIPELARGRTGTVIRRG